MASMNQNQKKLLLAFYTESQKKNHDYVNNITADTLEMSWEEFGEAFRYLYEHQLLWIYSEQTPVLSKNPPHLKKSESAFISSFGKELALKLLAEKQD